MPKALPIVDTTAPVCCAPVAAGPMSDDDALQVALRLKALADPARVKIMSLLFSAPDGEENSGELATASYLNAAPELTVTPELALISFIVPSANVANQMAPSWPEPPMWR